VSAHTKPKRWCSVFVRKRLAWMDIKVRNIAFTSVSNSFYMGAARYGNTFDNDEWRDTLTHTTKGSLFCSVLQIKNICHGQNPFGLTKRRKQVSFHLSFFGIESGASFFFAYTNSEERNWALPKKKRQKEKKKLSMNCGALNGQRDERGGQKRPRTWKTKTKWGKRTKAKVAFSFCGEN